MAGYFDELARTREMLNSRYDELKSGKVKPIDGEEFFENLRQREDECSRNIRLNDRESRALPFILLRRRTSSKFGNTSRQIICLRPERSERKSKVPSAPWFLYLTKATNART